MLKTFIFLLPCLPRTVTITNASQMYKLLRAISANEFEVTNRAQIDPFTVDVNFKIFYAETPIPVFIKLFRVADRK